MTLWYLARAAGLACLVMLSVATALGALGSVRTAAVGPRVVLQYLHRSAATLGLLILVGHVTAIVLDAQSGVSLSGVIVPFAAGYRPVAVALGTVAGYLFVLVAVLGAARGRLAGSARAARVWRGVHLSAYGAWGIAVLHGFLAGTDSGLLWVRALDVVVVAFVVAAVAVRLSTRRPRRAGVLAQLARVGAR